MRKNNCSLFSISGFKDVYLSKEENMLFDLCSLEQLVSDFSIVINRNLSPLIEEIRNVVIEYSRLYFSKINKNKIRLRKYSKYVRLLHNLKKKKTSPLIFKNNGSTYFFKPTLKVPESLKSFGSHPLDFFKIGKYLKAKNPLCIGIRSAGSFFAPPIVASLYNFNRDVEYLTLRPGWRINSSRFGGIVREGKLRKKGEIPFLVSWYEFNNIRKKITEAIIHERDVIVVDEGSGSGTTLSSIVNYLTNEGVKHSRIKIVVTRSLFPDLLKKFKGIKFYITSPIFFEEINNLFFGQLITNAQPNMKILKYEWDLISNRALLPLSKNLSLKGYESLKALHVISYREKGIILKKKVLAKFIGYGKIGSERYKIIQELGDTTVQPICFINGAVFYPFVKSEAVKKDEMFVYNVFKYFLKRLRAFSGKKRKYEDFINDFIRLIDSSFEDWSLNFISSTEVEKIKSKLLKLKSVLQKEVYIETMVDWRLEREEWLFTGGKIKKIDLFHIEDYADFPRADFLVQLAGLTIEFDLSSKYISLLLNLYKKRIIKKRISPLFQAFYLNLLYYLFWKLNFYSYILSFLKPYAYNVSLIEKKVFHYKRFLNSLLLLDPLEASVSIF